MPAIPTAVLSDRLEEVLGGRRLVSAVFLTFQFDPAFFEQEIVPVLLYQSFSHARSVRLVQLEDALRDLPGELAVYYDANGLVSSEGSAKLDIRRIPVRLRTGIFHAKNVFLLVEDAADAEDDGEVERSLIVGTLSANLTEAGWWRNVESAHFEVIEAGGKTRLRDDLLLFLADVRRRAGAAAGEQNALQSVVDFLRNHVDQRSQRSSGEGLHAHFFAGREPLDEFLEQVAGDRLRGCYLEVISPYFDDAATSVPLEKLIGRFGPSEIRVFLPRDNDGSALCNEALYRSVAALPRTSWGRLSGDLMRSGRAEQAQERFVHAKVYRFFRRNPAMEVLFVGTANLTRAAHQRGGNLESGVLVEVQARGRPEFWMDVDKRRPTEFTIKTEDEGTSTTAGSRLSLQYQWDSKKALAFWDDAEPSPLLQLEARSMVLGEVSGIAPRMWTELVPSIAEQLRETLPETSFVRVIGDRSEPVDVLVQEEGMGYKPSLLFSLSVKDILQYWSLLTAEQRAAFIEQKAPLLSLGETGLDLVTSIRKSGQVDTLFDRFAGIYHAFACLERNTRDELDRGAEKEAVFRLFGQKYDSLPTLLARLVSEETQGDEIERYVTALSAKQMHDELRRSYPVFWEAHAVEARSLREQFHRLESLRSALLAREPAEMGPFLDWFDSWFMRRAKPYEVANA